jgi:hypothetical protein
LSARTAQTTAYSIPGVQRSSTTAETSSSGYSSARDGQDAISSAPSKGGDRCSAARAHVLDRIGVGILDHLVDEALDAAGEEVANGDVELPEAVVLAPFLLVLVVIPQGRQVTAKRVDGAGAILVAGRAEPVAVQLQIRELVGQADSPEPATASAASFGFGWYAWAARLASASHHAARTFGWPAGRGKPGDCVGQMSLLLDMPTHDAHASRRREAERGPEMPVCDVPVLLGP